ncbi:MAG: nodulation protein NfeD, partial [Pseudomonadota bacterium]
GGAPPSPEPGSNPFEPEAEEPAAGDGETSANEEASEDPAADEEAAAEETATEEPPALGNDDALRAKVINDAAAYIRSLAELRGRNAEWGERAVRDAASLAANEALELNVIDVVATDIPDLLAQIDGRTIDINGEAVVLETEDMQLTRVEPDLLTRILAFISNPNVALIFMTIGTYGIIIEMWNPGSIFPGALGVASLVIGLYSFQVLSVNWMGAALMGLGVILIVVEAFAPSFGLIGLSGLTLFVIGAYLLFPGDAPGFEVSPVVIGTLAAFGAVFLGSILVAITRSRSHGPVIGIEAIRKREGFVDEWDNGTGTGHVIVEGERWAARCDKALEPGQRIRVLEVDGLVLVVKPVKG